MKIQIICPVICKPQTHVTEDATTLGSLFVIIPSLQAATAAACHAPERPPSAGNAGHAKTMGPRNERF